METTKEFLVDMKLMFEHGRSHATKNSRLNRRIAVHHLHFVVEQVLREKAKHSRFSNSLQRIGFEDIIKKLNKTKTIPDFNRLLELNTLRNNIQHHDQICGNEEVKLYTLVTEDFLKWSYKNYFKKNFERLKTEDLINNEEIKRILISSKNKIAKKDKQEAMRLMYDALGKFKLILFNYFFESRALSLSLAGKPLTIVLFDICLKTLFCNDVNTLKKLLNIACSAKKEGNNIILEYALDFNVPDTLDKVKEEYDDILNLILTYQDNFEFLESIPFG